MGWILQWTETRDYCTRLTRPFLFAQWEIRRHKSIVLFHSFSVLMICEGSKAENTHTTDAPFRYALCVSDERWQEIWYEARRKQRQRKECHSHYTGTHTNVCNSTPYYFPLRIHEALLLSSFLLYFSLINRFSFDFQFSDVWTKMKRKKT